MNTACMAGVEDARLFEAQRFSSPQADLIVLEAGPSLPFAVRRVFAVHAHQAVERGRHAHRECRQVLICLTGACEILIDDGSQRKTIALRDPQMALYVPPSIWAEQSYNEPGTILMVLCDRHYDEADYVRDYAAFLAYRSTNA